MTALDCPKLYKRCLKFAMALVRGWANQVEEARDIVQDGYILAIRFVHQWKPEEISYDLWVLRKIRDAWRKWIEKRSMMKRKMIGTMTDNLIHDEYGREVEPEIVVAPRQENLVLVNELANQRNQTQHARLNTEVGGLKFGQVSLRDIYLRTNRGDAKRRDPSEAARVRKPYLRGGRQAARCDLRRKRQDRTRAGLAFA